ncbi:MAG: gamma-butyrobetaine hydroxylase-like domain-containing protein [Candidatus Hydrothermarchaeales archaeon]
MNSEKQAEECCPVEISLLVESEFLHIVWDDGHLSDYSLARLRSHCPCSICQETGDYSRFERRDFQMPVISLVADTSVSIAWAHGRHTSVYSFTFLRSLCSCRICQAERMLGG